LYQMTRTLPNCWLLRNPSTMLLKVYFTEWLLMKLFGSLLGNKTVTDSLMVFTVDSLVVHCDGVHSGLLIFARLRLTVFLAGITD
jgi:hypothetical protein